MTGPNQKDMICDYQAYVKLTLPSGYEYTDLSSFHEGCNQYLVGGWFTFPQYGSRSEHDEWPQGSRFEGGWRDNFPFAVANGRLLAWRYRVDGGPDPILADLDRRCGAAHSAAIERAHRLLAIPHGSERASQAKALRACLRRHGIAVSSSGLATLLRAANEADVPVGECLDRHAVLFGV